MTQPKNKSNTAGWWQAPYPITTSIKNRWLFSGGVGVFIGLFLYIFRPFGIASLGVTLPFYTIGFGFMSFFIMALWSVAGRAWWLQRHDEEEWTVLHEIIIIILIISSIGLANYPLAQQPWLYGWSWSGLGLSFIWTAAIGIFPTVLSVLISERTKASTYAKSASKINEGIELLSGEKDGKETITFTSLSGTDTVTIMIHDLRYIKAADNYIIFHRVLEESLTKSLLRNTMKYATEKCSDYDHVLRVHKSYIANLHHVSRVSGNAQGYRLQMADISEDIPVSRSLNKKIKAQFKQG